MLQNHRKTLKHFLLYGTIIIIIILPLIFIVFYNYDDATLICSYPHALDMLSFHKKTIAAIVFQLSFYQVILITLQLMSYLNKLVHSHVDLKQVDN